MCRVFVLALLACLVACGGAHGAGADADATAVTIEGSDTMALLAGRWADAYMRTHPGVTILVSTGGTGTGVSALAHGTATIADASRPLTDDERALILEARGATPVEHRVAVDALAIYVHGSSPVRQLDLDQLASVLRGDTTRWSALGGDDAPIVLYGRDGGSGSRAWLASRVLGGAPFTSSIQALPGTAAVAAAVARDPHGLGYGGVAYARDVRTLSIVDRAGTPHRPDRTEAESGAYPLVRPLYFVTAGPPRGAAADFLRWVVTPAGQRVVVDAGYFPLEATARR